MTVSDEQSDQEPPAGAGADGLNVILSGCPDGLEQAVRDAARRSLQSGGCDRGHLEIAIVGDRVMRRENARWMARDGPTDVLAFDLRDEPLDGFVDGQLIVCEAVARREAGARKTDWRGELLLYVVHGCLHLCGHDDRNPHDAATMHRREDEILTSLGWGPVFSGRDRSSSG